MAKLYETNTASSCPLFGCCNHYAVYSHARSRVKVAVQVQHLPFYSIHNNGYHGQVGEAILKNPQIADDNTEIVSDIRVLIYLHGASFVTY